MQKDYALLDQSNQMKHPCFIWLNRIARTFCVQQGISAPGLSPLRATSPMPNVQRKSGRSCVNKESGILAGKSHDVIC